MRPAWLLPLACLLSSTVQARGLTVDDVLANEQLTQIVQAPGSALVVVGRTRPYKTAGDYRYDWFTRRLLSELWSFSTTGPPRFERLLGGEVGTGYWAAGLSPSGRRVAVFRLRGDRLDLGVLDLVRRDVRWLRVAPDMPYANPNPSWLDDDRLLLVGRPDRTLPVMLNFAFEPARRSPTAWSATSKGIRPSVSVLGSGRMLGNRDRAPPRDLIIYDIRTGGDCVPYLRGSPEWQVNRHVVDPASKKYMCRRAVQVSRIVQIDVAVADRRSPTGWVYGTFAYNGDQRGATFWDRLTPLGVQWGADPWTFPAVPKSDSLPLQQSVGNPGVGIFEHMGCQGRLAGPVDNPQSSCMSCHGSAYAARIGAKSAMGVNVPPSFGFDGLCTAYSFDNAAYFQNAPAPQSYPGGKYAHAMPLDTSLQLEVALQQYGQFATDGKPQACVDPAS